MDLKSTSSDKGLEHHSPAIESDFASVVSESKESIKAAEMVPPKASRGRKKLPRDASGNIIRDGSPQASKRVSGGAGPSVANQGTPSPSNPPPDIKKHLIRPLIGISKFPAQRYKIAELALDQEEAALCAESIQDLLNAFVPDVNQMSPKTAAVLGFFTTTGLIFFGKYQIYLEKRPKIETEEIQNSEMNGPDSANIFPSIPAEQAFRKQ